MAYGAMSLLSYLFFFWPTASETPFHEHLQTQSHNSSVLQKRYPKLVYTVYISVLCLTGGGVHHNLNPEAGIEWG